MSCGAATSRSPGAPSMTAVIASGVPLTTRRSPGVTRSVSAGGATTNRAVRAARTAVGAARPAASRTPASAPPAHRIARRRSSGSTTRASSSRARASTASACTIAPSGLSSTSGSSALRSVASSSGHCSSTRRAMRSSGGCACARLCTHHPAAADDDGDGGAREQERPAPERTQPIDDRPRQQHTGDGASGARDHARPADAPPGTCQAIERLPHRIQYRTHDTTSAAGVRRAIRLSTTSVIPSSAMP